MKDNEKYYKFLATEAPMAQVAREIPNVLMAIQTSSKQMHMIDGKEVITYHGYDENIEW